MSELCISVKKVVNWKNGKGQFIDAEEYPQTLWKWGISDVRAGKKYKITTVRAKLGNSEANERITEIVPDGETQIKLSHDSAIAEAQRSTNAYMKTRVAEKELKETATKNSDFFLHEVIAKQAEKIIELNAVLAKILLRIDDLERDNKIHFARENVLQNHCKVSLI